ncbi:MAG: NF038122 family metalloprotease [Planctomycetota bacterium]
MMNRNRATKIASLAVLAALMIGGHLAAQDTAPKERLFKRTGKPLGDTGASIAPIHPRGAGLIIVPTYAASINNHARAADIKATINAALAVYEATYSNPVTITLTFEDTPNGLGASSTYTTTKSYSSYRAALVSHASTADDTTALSKLPIQSANPVNGNTNMTIAIALARALGYTGSSVTPPSGDTDSTISLNISLMNILPSDTNQSKYSLTAVACHEIDEALGMGSQLDSNTTGDPYVEDLFRYDSSGNRSFTQATNASSYFSINGTTLLAQFNQDPGGDRGDWYSVNGGQTPQVQDAFGTPGTAEVLGVELTVLDVLGYVRVGGGGGPNNPPVISSVAQVLTSNPTTSSPVSFSAAATDPDNDSLTYTWDFGDGATGTGSSPTHSYMNAGSYTAAVTVTDGRGGSVSSSVNLTVTFAFNAVSLLKKKFSMNFKTLKDGIDITMTSNDFFTPADGTTVTLVIGDISLNSGTTIDTGILFRSKAKGDVGAFTLNTRSGTLRYATTKAQLQSLLAQYGATNTDTVTTVGIPIYMYFNGAYYGGTYNFTYTGKAGKTGAGK